MKIQYDGAVDAMHIQLSDKPFYKMTNINNDVNLDFDEQGNVIGIELLYGSRYADDVQEIIYQYSPKQSQKCQPNKMRVWRLCQPPTKHNDA